MRRALTSVRSNALLEAGCALLRLPPLDALARHVFFGRGSFPDIERRPAQGLSSPRKIARQPSA
jgi:hypothetical protein